MYVPHTIQNIFLIWISRSFKKGAIDNTISYFDQSLRFSGLDLFWSEIWGDLNKTSHGEKRTERSNYSFFLNFEQCSERKEKETLKIILCWCFISRFSNYNRHWLTDVGIMLFFSSFSARFFPHLIYFDLVWNASKVIGNYEKSSKMAKIRGKMKKKIITNVG